MNPFRIKNSQSRRKKELEQPRHRESCNSWPDRQQAVDADAAVAVCSDHRSGKPVGSSGQPGDRRRSSRRGRHPPQSCKQSFSPESSWKTPAPAIDSL